MGLANFLLHKNAHKIHLLPAEVVALQLYTTLLTGTRMRDMTRYANGEFRVLPVCTKFAYDGIKRLRSVHMDWNGVQVVLWRGMRNVRVSEDFENEGGTELAFMSTTTNPEVAIRYSLSGKSLIFNFVPDNFMSVGTDHNTQIDPHRTRPTRRAYRCT